MGWIGLALKRLANERQLPKQKAKRPFWKCQDFGIHQFLAVGSSLHSCNVHEAFKVKNPGARSQRNSLSSQSDSGIFSSVAIPWSTIGFWQFSAVELPTCVIRIQYFLQFPLGRFHNQIFAIAIGEVVYILKIIAYCIRTYNIICMRILLL